MLSPEAKAKLMAYANPRNQPPPSNAAGADGKPGEPGGEGEDPAEFRFVESDSMVRGDGEDDEEDSMDEASGECGPKGEPTPDDYETVGADKFNARRREEMAVRRPRPDMREMMREAAGVKRG